MKIYVCVKHVPDSAANIKILDKNLIDENITFIINPYDEHAIEEAVQLKSVIDDGEMIAVSVGKKDAVKSLRSALAMGADRGIHIVTETVPDTFITAQALKAGILSDGWPDIIFTGKESIDSEGFQTMFRLGVALDIPVATNVVAFTYEGEFVEVECELEAGGIEVLRVALPCIISAGKSLNQPRYPTIPDIMKARKKPIQTIALDNLDIKTPSGRMEILELRPEVNKRRRHIIPGTAEESVQELIRLLRVEEKVI
jgi:electron transfer flavoprotein beta subunit